MNGFSRFGCARGVSSSSSSSSLLPLYVSSEDAVEGWDIFEEMVVVLERTVWSGWR